MGEEDEQWNATVKEWLIDEGYNYAGFVGGKEEQDKWELVYAKPQEREIAISDEETKKVSVDETNCLWEIITEGNKGKFPNGIWFGGTKYTLVRQQILEVEGHDVTVYFCSRPGGGACIACSNQSVVVAFSDKTKGQEGGNSLKAVLNFVGYLFDAEG